MLKLCLTWEVNFMNIIQKKRQKLGLSQSEFSNRSGVKLSTLQKIELGENIFSVRSSTLQAIAEALFTTSDKIVREQIAEVINNKLDISNLRFVTAKQVALATEPAKLEEYSKIYNTMLIKNAINEQKYLYMCEAFSHGNCKHAINQNGVIYCSETLGYCNDIDDNCFEIVLDNDENFIF